MIEHAAATTGGKDGIHLRVVWWMGNISYAFAAVPDLTPLCRTLLHIDFRTILLLALLLSAVSHRLCQRGVEQESGAVDLSAHA
jgi:hypothetical protein